MFSYIIRILGIVMLVAFVTVPAFVNTAIACDSCKMHSSGHGQSDQHGAMKAGHGDNSEVHGMMDADGKAKGPMMAAVFTAEHLYTCPMHAEVITDNAEAKCPLCNMKLMAMTEEKVLELRNSEPRGCPMDPIVASNTNQVERCPMCKMNLSEIKHETHDQMEKGMTTPHHGG